MVIPSNSKVCVRLGDEYIVKSAENLAEGDDILIMKEKVKGISLKKVEEALLESKRYAMTYPILFVELKDGSHTPLFRYELFSGMAEMPGNWPLCISSDVALRTNIKVK